MLLLRCPVCSTYYELSTNDDVTVRLTPEQAMKRFPDMPDEVVYVELLHEGVEVWRPVDAQALGGDRFRLAAGHVPEGEVWTFEPGSTVRCERRGADLVAVEAVGPDSG